MAATVQVGTILIEQALIARVLGLESDPYSGPWGVVKTFDGSALDRKLHSAGWNFFFMAAETKVMFFGVPGATKVQNALRRILEKVKPQHFNSLEITGMVARRFLGVPYVTVSAHSRHIQQSCHLDALGTRCEALSA